MRRIALATVAAFALLTGVAGPGILTGDGGSSERDAATSAHADREAGADSAAQPIDSPTAEPTSDADSNRADTASDDKASIGQPAAPGAPAGNAKAIPDAGDQDAADDRITPPGSNPNADDANADDPNTDGPNADDPNADDPNADPPVTVPGDLDTTALLATNSIRIQRNAAVETGDVVVNDVATSPTLGEASLQLNQGANIDAGLAAGDTIKLDRNTAVGGDLYHNGLNAHATATFGSEFTPISLPVFTLPPFPSVPGPGEFGPIFVASGQTLVLDPGTYETESIDVDSSGKLVFNGPIEFRVAGRVDFDQGSEVGPATGADLLAGDIRFFVGGSNGGTGGPNGLPAAVSIGRDSVVTGSFYAPFGTFDQDRDASFFGQAIARDINIDTGATVDQDGASPFVNQPPTADPQDVFTSGSPITITLTGSDPDDDDLLFSIDDTGTLGTVSNLVNSDGTCTPQPCTAPDKNTATVDYTPPAVPPDDPDPLDSFQFTVDDGNGNTDTATVTVNPEGDENEPPDDPVSIVVAKDRLFEEETGVEVESPNSAAIVLVVAAPFTPAPGAQVAGDIGDLTFEVITPPGTGSLDTNNPATNVPNNPADPGRSATVVFTPNSIGTTSFQFEACGSVVVAPPTVGTTFCDTATVEINVSAATPPSPPDVAPLSGALTPDSSAIIDLADGILGANADGSEEPVGRPPAGVAPSAAQQGDDDGGALAAHAPGIYFLVDTTGSTGTVLAQTKADIAAVIADVQATFPDAEFGLGEYKDFPFDPFAFNHRVTIGPDDGVGGAADVTDSVATLSASGGGDLPEAQFYAMDQILTPANTAGFDPTQDNILVLMGDAPGHDVVCSAISGLPYDITEFSVTSKLLEPQWLPVGTANGAVSLVAKTTSTNSGGLNGDPTANNTDYAATCGAEKVVGEPGQAIRMADATGGSFLDENTDAAALAQAIEDAIEPPPPFTYTVTLAATFAGTLTDSTGTPIPVPTSGTLTTAVPTSTLTYSSTGLPLETTTNFGYTATSTSTGLSASETVFINVVATGDCVTDVEDCEFGR